MSQKRKNEPLSYCSSEYERIVLDLHALLLADEFQSQRQTWSHFCPICRGVTSTIVG